MTSNTALLVGNFFASSVSSRAVCEDLADRLSGAGWHVVTTSLRRGRCARLTDMAATAWKSRRDYRVAQVDVFSGPAFVWAEAVCGVLRAAGKPYVLTLHGGNLPAFARQWPRRVQRVLGSAAAVTTPSAYLLERMRPFRRDIYLIPNAIALERYSFRLRSHVTPRLVWLRAFHRIYNPMLAPSVLARLAEASPQAYLVMIGPNKKDGSLELTSARAARLGVAGRLQFAGGVPNNEVPQWLESGDIFLNTPNIDNTPVSVLEAMACGLCVVSTDAGGLPQLIADECDGLLSRAGDAEAMAANVVRLLDDPRLAGTLSLNARRKAESFDWARILPKWTALLSSVSAGN